MFKLLDLTGMGVLKSIPQSQEGIVFKIDVFFYFVLIFMYVICTADNHSS